MKLADAILPVAAALVQQMAPFMSLYSTKLINIAQSIGIDL